MCSFQSISYICLSAVMYQCRYLYAYLKKKSVLDNLNEDLNNFDKFLIYYRLVISRSNRCLVMSVIRNRSIITQL